MVIGEEDELSISTTRLVSKPSERWESRHIRASSLSKGGQIATWRGRVGYVKEQTR